MLFLSHQLLLLCSFLSPFVCAAPSQRRFTVSFAASTGISPVQDLPVSSSHQQPLTVSGSCPLGYNSCSSIGNSGLCCRSNQICSIDDAGYVACCPVNALCTGVIGGTTSIPTKHVRTITVTRTTTITKPCGSTVSYHLPVRGTSVACSAGFHSCPPSLGGGCCSLDQKCASKTCVPLSSASSTASNTQSTSALYHHTPNRQGFQCPDGTAACTLLNPNLCCPVGETCQTLQDPGTGLGNVGCCPDGQLCGGDLPSICPTGYSGCPNNAGGGCCIPGYTCYDVGCVLSSTSTIVPTSSTISMSSTTTSIFTPAPPTSLPNCAYGTPCGYYSPQCCATDEYCYVNPEYVAQCTTTNTGHWEPITSTYVTTTILTLIETIPTTLTTTEYSTSVTTKRQTMTTTGSAFECQSSLGETNCGNICCLAGQFCVSAGHCTAGGIKEIS